MTDGEKLDLIIENQEYTNKLLESIVETMPQPGTKPDLKAMLEPLADNPAIKNNPMLAGLINSFMKNAGG